MPHAIRFHKAGGPEVLQWEEVQVGKPGAGEARVRHTAVGLNYVETYVRSGLYPAPLPSGLGTEAAGVVAGEGCVLVTNRGSGSLAWVDARTLETRIVLNTAPRPNGVAIVSPLHAAVAACIGDDTHKPQLQVLGLGLRRAQHRGVESDRGVWRCRNHAGVSGREALSGCEDRPDL